MTDIETMLTETAGRVDWPSGDVASRAMARIRENTISSDRRRLWPRVALAIAAAVVVLFALPAGREAVADLLGVVGIKVGWSTETTVPAGASLELGEQISLEGAAQLVDFAILAPHDPGFGDPDAIYYSEGPPRAIHMVWRSDETLPAAGGTGIGLLYTQFSTGGADFLVKSLSPEVDVEELLVRGNPGFWVEGAHLLALAGPGEPEEGRLAANVLAWTEDGVTHRIETTGGLTETLLLAESLG